MSLTNSLKKISDTDNLSETIGIIGKSQQIQAVLKKIVRVAASDSTVLITGESGTGKELIARAIHHLSRRSQGPMITINCGAIPSELLESELFGHEKGSFTGAHKTRIGRFEMAAGGTIFLDEIGDMNQILQVKLLRAIQEQTFERVGGEKSVSVDIRIISATNKDLTKAVGNGSFREDLFYRLNVIPVQVPPLRERDGDIPFLCEFFLERFAERMEEPVKKISESAELILNAYAWPGNVRELENLMERLSVMVDGDVINADDLPENMISANTPDLNLSSSQSSSTYSNGNMEPINTPGIFRVDDSMDFYTAVENFQKCLILNALNKTGWVKAKAAEMLKLNRTTLVEKIKKLEIEQPEGDDT